MNTESLGFSKYKFNYDVLMGTYIPEPPPIHDHAKQIIRILEFNGYSPEDIDYLALNSGHPIESRMSQTWDKYSTSSIYFMNYTIVLIDGNMLRIRRYIGALSEPEIRWKLVKPSIIKRLAKSIRQFIDNKP